MTKEEICKYKNRKEINNRVYNNLYIYFVNLLSKINYITCNMFINSLYICVYY